MVPERDRGEDPNGLPTIPRRRVPLFSPSQKGAEVWDHTRASRFVIAHIARTLYLRAGRCPISWPHCMPVAASPLLAELIGYLEDPALDSGRRSHAKHCSSICLTLS